MIGFSLLIAAMGIAPQTASETHRLEITVLASRAPSIQSGIYKSWIIVIGADKDGAVHNIFIPYMSKSQQIPRVDKSCLFVYRDGDIEGIIGKISVNSKSSHISDEFYCK